MSEQRGSEQSRRSFLGQAVAVAGVAAIAGSAAASNRAGKPAFVAERSKKKAVRLAPGETIRMAVIGTGGMGTGHCQSTMAMAKRGEENVQIVALADVNQVRMADAHRRCESEQGITVDQYTDYRKLLERDDIHGVLVASPEHWHGKHCTDALMAGKDVYCEKPMTLRLEEGLALREVVLKNPDRIFCVGTQKIILPKYIEARRLIKEGAIGKPTMSQTSYCRNSKDGEWLYYGLDPKWQPGVNMDWEAWLGDLPKRPWSPEIYARWRRYKDFSTGIVGDLLVHEITPLIMALDSGWPTRVCASGGHYVDKKMENHDTVNLNVEFEDGHTMIIAGSTANEVGLETLIRGHKGNMFLNSRHVVIRPERLYVDDIDARTVECADIGNDQEKLRLNWWQCMRSREPAISNVELATKVMVAVDLATRSMWDGAAYGFDPETMRARKL